MESITHTAIVAALSAGAATDTVKAGGSALVGSYQELKAALRRTFGDQSEIVKVVDMLENRPDSEWRQGMLMEVVQHAQPDQDPNVRKAAQQVLNRLEEHPGGEQHVQYARGNYIAQADRGSTATVNIDPQGII
jgi:hypothetical protein